ncbi:MAG: DNA repair protein RecN [Nitrospinales bacterium]
MLKELKVNNYAIIESLSVEFNSGFNIFTGETGAGKSIIIGALNLVLGGRADPSSIRSSEKSASVEAFFEVNDPKSLKLIHDLGIEVEDGQVIIKRTFSLEGKSRAHLNGSSITIANLSKVGDRLVDIHGQHQHQTLLHTENHLEMLDLFGKLAKEKTNFQEDFSKRQSKAQLLEKLLSNENGFLQRQDLLNFQINEIDQISPAIGEDEELKSERNKLRHAEKLGQSLQNIQGMLSDSEPSAIELIGIANKDLEELIQIDPSLEKQGERGKTAFYELQELAEEIRDYSRSLEVNPTRLEEIEDRLAEINGLKRKYGNDISSILEYREKIGEELLNISGGQEKIDELKAELDADSIKLTKMAIDLAEKRERIAKKLQKSIEKELQELYMKQARFQVGFYYETDPESFAVYKNKNVKISSNGLGSVEFLFSSNPGEDLRPLAKIASGGELSRMMLALKTILNEQDSVPSMVFDEVDSGISGKVAEKVGEKLKKIADNKQVFAITHLPQIAGLAGTHYLIQKAVKSNRTRSMILELDHDQRVKEIARMSGGEKITEATLKHAREMIK